LVDCNYKVISVLLVLTVTACNEWELRAGASDKLYHLFAYRKSHYTNSKPTFYITWFNNKKNNNNFFLLGCNICH